MQVADPPPSHRTSSCMLLVTDQSEFCCTETLIRRLEPKEAKHTPYASLDSTDNGTLLDSREDDIIGTERERDTEYILIAPARSRPVRK